MIQLSAITKIKKLRDENKRLRAQVWSLNNQLKRIGYEQSTQTQKIKEAIKSTTKKVYHSLRNAGIREV